MPIPPSLTLAERHTRLQAALSAQSLTAMVVTSAPNIRYLTNHDGSAGVLVVSPTGMHLIVDGRYTQAVRAKQESPYACPSLTLHDVPTSYDAATIDLLAGLGASVAGFEAGHVTVARHAGWLRTLASRGMAVELRPVEGMVERARAVKDASEIETLRRSARGLTPVASAVLKAMRAGMTERVLAGVIEAELRAAGYDRVAFEPIVASGPNAALPHYRAGDRVISEGDMVVLDFGGVLDGYCSDLTRTVSVGEPSDELRRVYGAVLDAQQAAIHAIRPGNTTEAVDAAARSVLVECGLGEAFSHGTGHGIGLEIHEDPRLARAASSAPTALEAGMVTTVEPGAYLPGWGGIRIEDDILVTSTGYEILTNVPRHLLVVG
ncbi:MAG: Xaa-Pro peptidase family protein [Vicinamibacterales bacterium]